MAAAPKKTVTRAREVLVWELASRGWLQSKIAAKVEKEGLGRMSVPAVCQMLKRLEIRHHDRMANAIQATKTRQTGSLEIVFREAMLAWERSRKVAWVRKVKTLTIYKGDTSFPAEEQTITTKGREGDPRYLTEAMKALKDIRDIWGIEPAPTLLLRAGLEDPAAALAALIAASKAVGDDDGPIDDDRDEDVDDG